MKLRTSDIALCANLSPYVVREYIDAGLLGPIELSENNYRWIDPRAIPQAQLWRTLQQLGFSMEQLQELGQKRTPENALELFADCGGRLEQEIAELQARQEMLRSYISLIEEGQSVRPGEIEVRTLAERPIHSISLDQAGDETNEYKRLRECIVQLPNSGSPLGYIYSDFLSLLERPDRPAQLVSFDPKGAELRPAGLYLIGTTASDGEEPAGLSSRMLAYARQNDLEICGPVWSVYLHDAVSAAKQEHYLLQLYAIVSHIVAGA
jgi:DNA-binding transcriptional MerR regulator